MLGSLLTVIGAGQLIEGACESVTVTVNEQEAIRPALSVTTYAWVVVPTGKELPEAKPAVRAVFAPGQASVPEGVVKETAALHELSVFGTVIGLGHPTEP